MKAAGLVPGLLQQRRQGLDAGRQQVSRRCRGCRSLPGYSTGQQGSVRRRRQRGLGRCVCEPHTLSGQAIERRRGSRAVAVAAQVVGSHGVERDQQDVVSRRLCVEQRDRDQCRTETQRGEAAVHLPPTCASFAFSSADAGFKRTPSASTCRASSGCSARVYASDSARYAAIICGSLRIAFRHAVTASACFPDNARTQPRKNAAGAAFDCTTSACSSAAAASSWRSSANSDRPLSAW